jgi:hypothetical protein
MLRERELMMNEDELSVQERAEQKVEMKKFLDPQSRKEMLRQPLTKNFKVTRLGTPESPSKFSK